MTLPLCNVHGLMQLYLCQVCFYAFVRACDIANASVTLCYELANASFFAFIGSWYLLFAQLASFFFV